MYFPPLCLSTQCAPFWYSLFLLEAFCLFLLMFTDYWVFHYNNTNKCGGSAEVTSWRTTSTAAGGVRWPAADPPVSWLRSRRGKWLRGKQGFLLSARLIIVLSRTWDLGQRGSASLFAPHGRSWDPGYTLFFIGEFPFVNRGRWPTRRSAPSKWCAVLGPWTAPRWSEETDTFPSFKGTRRLLSRWVNLLCCYLYDRALWHGQQYAIFDCLVAKVVSTLAC